MDSMEIVTSNHINGDEPVRLELRPVRPMESGEGLPYAPENWPNRGDTWRWKVGPRVTGKGNFMDRYLYPPKHLPNLNPEVLRNGHSFRSKTSLERYIRSTYPNADIGQFFNSFSWIIPSVDGLGRVYQNSVPHKPQQVYSSEEEEDQLRNIAVCKAGNDKCSSLIPRDETVTVMTCDICCAEPDFCTVCSCILCCKSVSLERDGYSYIKCEATVSPEGLLCGHVAHLNCALRAYMAGTVGGCIGLDAEYYCRRCDAKMDLVSHVSKFLEICQSLESQSDVEKILNLGICILRGSQRDDAKELLNCIESTLIKIKCGMNLEDFSNDGDDKPTLWSDEGFSVAENTLQSLQDVTPVGVIPFNYHAEIHKHEEEIREVLISLRKAQKSEYQIAEGRLLAQKERLYDLYRQLDKEKSELSNRVSGKDEDGLMMDVLKRMDQIRNEVQKLKEMEEVAKGFGKVSRGIVEEYFHLRIDD